MIEAQAGARRAHTMPFGAECCGDGQVRFALWAPSASQVTLQLSPGSPNARSWSLERNERGWYTGTHAARAGTRYNYRIDDKLDVPDPGSRCNPGGVHGASEVVDPHGYVWQTTDWRGRSWSEAVVYELHVGTFTSRGTFAAIESRLGELSRLGVTAIELMPVAAFSGRYGWGYDGVLPFAPHAPYGAPNELKRLIDTAHAHGLMILLDVVYNHFGPDGNYLHSYAQQFFTHRHRTPWGDAVNFDDADADIVRQFFIHNALYWLEEYRFDGLRIDAVHAIRDDSARHFIDELRDAVQQGPGRERHVHLVLENHYNTAALLRDRQRVDGVPVSMSQWNDDIHHALHVATTGETDGYYVDFADNTLAYLGRALAEGFAYQGESSAYGGNVARGEPSADLPVTAFVNFLQTHDQVGNRAFGERISALADPEALRAAYAIVLLAPQPPMLFMGEEYAALQPFLYFCDFSGDLATAVTQGRRREFARFAAFADPEALAQIPDPCARSTLAASRLRWSDRRRAPHRHVLRYVAGLLRLRANRVVPLVPSLAHKAARYELHGKALIVNWPLQDGKEGLGSLVLQANLSSANQEGMVASAAAIFFSTAREVPVAPDEVIGLLPWEVRWMHCEGRKPS